MPAEGSYVLQGGDFTPPHLVGSQLDTLNTRELLEICTASPIPAFAETADTTDADVLAVRLYLATPFGQVRLALAGNLTAEYGPEGPEAEWP
jgi:hypothetical protein